jgi:hypothetical protein
MTYTVIVRETVERSYTIEAESLEAAKEAFEATPGDELGEYHEECVDCGIVALVGDDGTVYTDN